MPCLPRSSNLSLHCNMPPRSGPSRRSRITAAGKPSGRARSCCNRSPTAADRLFLCWRSGGMRALPVASRLNSSYLHPNRRNAVRREEDAREGKRPSIRQHLASGQFPARAEMLAGLGGKVAWFVSWVMGKTFVTGSGRLHEQKAIGHSGDSPGVGDCAECYRAIVACRADVHCKRQPFQFAFGRRERHDNPQLPVAHAVWSLCDSPEYSSPNSVAYCRKYGLCQPTRRAPDWRGVWRHGGAEFFERCTNG